MAPPKCLACFFFGSIILSSLCAPVPPLHSDGASSSWVCNDGYFRTTPLSINNATCRPCTTVAAPCSVGWIWTPCTKTANTCCVPCPPLPMGTIYTVRNTCEVRGCSAGYYMDYSSSSLYCMPCEKGFYCPQQGAPQQCGVNCTTTVQGASSSLDCVQFAGDPFGFAVAYTFASSTTLGEGDVLFSCPDLLLWIAPYGSVQACSLLSSSMADNNNNNNNIGTTVTCTVAASRCVAGDFLQWALRAQNPADDAKALASCLKDRFVALITTRPTIEQVGPLPPRNTDNNNNNNNDDAMTGKNTNNSTNAPLVIEAHRWGAEHAQTFSTYVMVTMFLSGLGSGTCAAVALACTRWYTRRKMAEVATSIKKNHAEIFLERLKKAAPKVETKAKQKAAANP